ncbi:hypothetical protein HU200_061131 [Digitaria exilis]|uniref:F-box protein n=1 Tax=Digitaria exilis TaxID=1010633 RepID=A0A835DZM0_9POAL|nr:hypothetical protein HU200_061131 [Digitaria exilis]
MDLVEWLGPDASAIVFACLRDRADLGRALAVSRSWRTFVMVVHLSKIQCLRLFPEVKFFAQIVKKPTKSAGSDNSVAMEQDAGLTCAASTAWENHKIEQEVYKRLAHALLSNYPDASCIAACIGASTTDFFPDESIQNTLIAGDEVNDRPSYWSSRGHENPGFPEFLLYKLSSDLCLIDEIRIQPFRATFQHGKIYSVECVRFKFGCPKSHLRPEDLVSEVSEGQLALLPDDSYIWTYTSPGFRMQQENVLQSFKLPRPVLRIGGVVKVEFWGRVQKQEIDNLYYVCVSHVEVLGSPLTREWGVAPCDNGLILKYYPDHESLGNSGSRQINWRDFEARLWRGVMLTGQGIGFNQDLLSRLLGPSCNLP